MLISVRKASEGDLKAVSRIYSQVQAMHVEWRPDIYKPNDDLPGRERFLELAESGLLYVAAVAEEGMPADPGRIEPDRTDPDRTEPAGACSPEAYAGPVTAGVLELQLRHIENPAQVTRDVIFVDTMAVDEAYRGRGIGRAFFEFLKRMRDEGGYDGIELQVNARNRAAYDMYTHCGFREKSINMELVE